MAKKKGKKKNKDQAVVSSAMAEADYAPIAKEFVEQWAALMTNWGFPKALGTVHGWLLSQAATTTMQEVRDANGLSQGTAYTMLKRLVDMGLVHEEHRTGTRQVRYLAERDVWQVALAVLRVRRAKELEPLLALRGLLERLPAVDGPPVVRIEEDAPLPDSAAVLSATLQPFLKWAEQVDGLMAAFEVQDEKWWSRLVKKWKNGA